MIALGSCTDSRLVFHGKTCGAAKQIEVAIPLREQESKRVVPSVIPVECQTQQFEILPDAVRPMQHMEGFFGRIKVDRIRCAPYVEASLASAALAKYFVSSRATWEKLPTVIIVSKNDLDKAKLPSKQPPS